MNIEATHMLIYIDGRHGETVFAVYSPASVICFIQ